jgi:hypothetical protein
MYKSCMISSYQTWEASTASVPFLGIVRTSLIGCACLRILKLLLRTMLIIRIPRLIILVRLVPMRARAIRIIPRRLGIFIKSTEVTSGIYSFVLITNLLLLCVLRKFVYLLMLIRHYQRSLLIIQ